MVEKKKVIVVGATGEIGSALCKRLLEEPAYSLVVFSRDPQIARQKVAGAKEYIQWQPEFSIEWAAAVDGAFAVVNLAGARAFGTRWTKAYRQQLHENRMTIVRGLVQAIEQASSKPHVFINGSSVGTYGFTNRSTKEVDEETPLDNDSYTQESLDVEQEAAKAEAFGVRTVNLRTGFVLDKNGGGLTQMAGSMRRYMGGIILPGTQWLPWIHIDDEVGIILKALEDDRVRGPINATAPDVPTNRAFMQTMGRLLERPVIMRLPGFVLHLFLGDADAILTRGKRVIPSKIQNAGYHFQYPTLEQALMNLLR
jgi:uncharacterized protein (TIGR01777 family)